MKTDPMVLAQLRLAEAVMDALDEIGPGAHMAIGTDEWVFYRRARIDRAVHHVREVEARDRQGVG